MMNTNINKQSREYIENQYGALCTFAKEKIEHLKAREDDEDFESFDNWYAMTEGDGVITRKDQKMICEVNIWKEEEDDEWSAVVHPVREEDEDGYAEVDYINMVRLGKSPKAIWI